MQQIQEPPNISFIIVNQLSYIDNQVYQRYVLSTSRFE